MGITEEFRPTDKILAAALVIWNFGWFTTFVVLTVVNLTFKAPTSWWAGYWHVIVMMNFVMGIPITIWFAIGGFKDIKALLRTLATATRDQTDDGRVVHDPESGPKQVEVAPAGDALVDETPSEVRN